MIARTHARTPPLRINSNLIGLVSFATHNTQHTTHNAQHTGRNTHSRKDRSLLGSTTLQTLLALLLLGHLLESLSLVLGAVHNRVALGQDDLDVARR